MSKPSLSLKLAQRQFIRISTDDMVQMRPLFSHLPLPLLVEPSLPGLDAASWIERHRDQLTGLLHQHGAILFRGFQVDDEAAFQRTVIASGLQIMNYIEKATPRDDLGQGIYTSTYFPQEYAIALHNELSYVKTWPGQIFFGCIVPSASGGETPLADVRRVLARIDPEIREEFRRRGWRLVRSFGSGIGPSWQHSYAVETIEEVEAYLQSMDITWSWSANGWLRTRQIRPAIHTHPQTGDELWFNHIAFWHSSSLPASVRSRFEADFGVDNLPYNTFYGDGGVIPDSVAACLREAYEQETIAFPWHKGDFLMADNMLVAHGRTAFTGERRVLAAMGNPVALDIAKMMTLQEHRSAYVKEQLT